MALYNLGSLYEKQGKFDSAVEYYLQAMSFDAETIISIIRLVPKVSNELQFKVLESVPRIRNIEFSQAVLTLFMEKKAEMVKYLSHCLIRDVVNICVAYY
jgi:hypothetical protein